MALGATPAIHALLFREGFLTVFAGLAIGFVAPSCHPSPSRCCTRNSNESAHSMLIAGCFVVITSTLACWFPANHATKIDPISALRRD